MVPGKPSGAGVPADDQPMRAELFSVSQLEQHARQLARLREIGPGPAPIVRPNAALRRA